ncbi:MAG: CoA protein activase [Deltaproteobacteria bacterium]
MRVSFPHMGNVYIPLKALLEGIHVDVVAPPPITARTLELGVKYSPECACLPLKINVGNFVEALENGADTIVMAGGWGPCRFGYYAQVEREILRDLGYNFKMVVLEAPDSKLTELLKQIRALGQNTTVREAYGAIKFAWFKLGEVELLEKKLEYLLPRVIDPDRIERIYQAGVRQIDEAVDRPAVRKARQDTIRSMEGLDRHQRDILKIGLIGEIYTILEPSTNCHVARHLGRIGVEVTRSIYISDWVNDHLAGGLIKPSNHRQIMRSSRPYLNYQVGGHGRETVGNAVDFARRGYDGIIQIGPLTCMPEIVAQSVLGRVSQEEAIPCMTIYFDEHSGTAGVYTRLEAYIDMLQRKKNLGLMASG